MRRCLRALAGVWLACQLVALASPLTLANDRFGIDQASCWPGIGPGQICPMHHHAAGDRSTCKMESACAHRDAGLLTILATGALPLLSASTSAVSLSGLAASLVASTRSHAFVPDLPPPRA